MRPKTKPRWTYQKSLCVALILFLVVAIVPSNAARAAEADNSAVEAIDEVATSSLNSTTTSEQEKTEIPLVSESEQSTNNDPEPMPVSSGDEEIQGSETTPAPDVESGGFSGATPTRAGGEDVTPYITFTNGELTGPGGTISDGDAGIIFEYLSRYVFSIDFEVDLAALNVAISGRDGLVEGDYFTFMVPEVFKGLTFNITKDGEIWGSLIIEASDDDGDGKVVGTVVFTEDVEGKTKISGGLEFTIYYGEKDEGMTELWEFEFGHTYTYGGVSGGENEGPVRNNPSESKNRKSGRHVDGQIYSWSIYANISQDSWDGTITVTDTLGSGQKVTELSGNAETRYSYYGAANYGVPDSDGRLDLSNYYFAIAVVDWDKMRTDYNNFYIWSVAVGKTTLWVDQVGDGTYTDTNYSLTELTPNDTYTEYMWSRMRDWTLSDGSYKYLRPYTGGLESVTVTYGGFEIVFPEGTLDEKSILIYYHSELTAGPALENLNNSVIISGGGDDTELEATVRVAAGGVITGKQGLIVIHKYDTSESNQLGGAEFRLTENFIPYSQTKTTDASGEAIFTLSTSGYAGTYTLTEETPPKGYTALEPMSITLNDNGEIIHVNGMSIPSSATDGTMISDSYGNVICKVSTDRLVLVVYNELSLSQNEVSRTVNKRWFDDNDVYGMRPGSIQVQLYAGGVAYDLPITLDASNGWIYTWSNLPEQQDGQTIIYTVQEVGVPAGYISSTGETDGTFTITNRYSTEAVSSVADAGQRTDTNSPITGDVTTVWPWVTLIVLSTVSIFGLVVFRKRGKKVKSNH